MLFRSDVDLSYRIHKKYKLIVDTSLQVTHIGGESFNSADNWKLYGTFILSMIYFFEKHYSRVRTLILKILVRLNSYLILSIEALKSIAGGHNIYRVNKHRYLLKLLREKD